MNNIDNFTELKKSELTQINGGHKGFFYKAGVVWMSAGLFGLGLAAGLWEGITEK